MPSALPASKRLLSLDVFRGATIALMILVNNSGSNAYSQLRHAHWNGLTLTDLVFPFFLWIVGVAMVFSFSKRIETGSQTGRLALHTLRRSAILFGLGVLLNGFPAYNLATLRIPGVLQRIALCYLAASLLYLYTSRRAQIFWTFGLMAVYAVLMLLAPVPGFGAGVLEPVGNFGQYIDDLLLSGHLYRDVWDPEGLVTTLPAISTTMFGVLAGYLLQSALDGPVKTVYLFLSGNALILLGLALTPFMPINKQLWTISYAPLVAGLASVCFAACYWIIDLQGRRRYTEPFVIFGMNAIAAYVFHGLLGRALSLIRWTGSGGEPVSLSGYLYQAVYPAVAPGAANAAFLYALTHVAISYLFVWVLYRNRWFLKI